MFEFTNILHDSTQPLPGVQLGYSAKKRRLTEREVRFSRIYIYRLAFLSRFYAIRPNVLLPCDALPFAMYKIRPFSTWRRRRVASMKIGASAANA